MLNRIYSTAKWDPFDSDSDDSSFTSGLARSAYDHAAARRRKARAERVAEILEGFTGKLAMCVADTRDDDDFAVDLEDLLDRVGHVAAAAADLDAELNGAR